MLLSSTPLSHQHCCSAGRLRSLPVCCMQHKRPSLRDRTTSMAAYAQAAAAAVSAVTPPVWQPRLKHRSISRCVVARAGFAGVGQPDGEGSPLERNITRDITRANSVPVLENVVLEWGGCFNTIHIAAALAKLAKLRGGKSAQPLLQRLNSMWLQQLPDARNRALANVLWAWGRLDAADSTLWDSTLAAFVADTVLTNYSTCSVEGKPQHCTNVLWACAKLRRPPNAEQLQVMLQVLGNPEVVKAPAAQEVANAVWAVSELRTLRDFQADISPQLVQQLLGKDQVQLVAYEGTAQNVSNLLLALARLATGPGPLLSLNFAQGCARQLLAAAQQRGMGRWEVQNISNSLWACGELQLRGEAFVRPCFSASAALIPASTTQDIVQAAQACVTLQHRDAAFMAQLLQRSKQLCLQPQQGSSSQAVTGRGGRGGRGGKGRPISDREKGSMAAVLPAAVAALDLHQLAGDVVSLVSSSGIKQQHSTHPSNLRRLYRVHVWLQQQQLLDGRGLSGLLTEQQLQQGAKEAAAWVDKGL